jgi:hypothetical protein
LFHDQVAANDDALNPDKQEELKANKRNQRQNGGAMTDKVGKLQPRLSTTHHHLRAPPAERRPLSSTPRRRQEREIATRRNALKEQLGAMWNAFSAQRQAVIRRPLWRHRLLGEFSPPPGEVLRGATYFRLVTMALVVVYIRPHLAVLKVNHTPPHASYVSQFSSFCCGPLR